MKRGTIIYFAGFLFVCLFLTQRNGPGNLVSFLASLSHAYINKDWQVTWENNNERLIYKRWIFVITNAFNDVTLAREWNMKRYGSAKWFTLQPAPGALWSLHENIQNGMLKYNTSDSCQVRDEFLICMIWENV